jgi:plasmid maintenance system antidote protein VapI
MGFGDDLIDILHESLHLLSKQKWLVRRDVGTRHYRVMSPERAQRVLADNELLFWQHRSGYRSFSSYADKRENKQHEHFQGLNEAVIDKLALEIVRKHIDELVQELAITPEEKAEIGPYYQFEFIEVLDIIIRRLAESMQVSEREIWKEFARGLFTGEMMHLREVELFFGKGALRVLGALGDPELTPFSKKVIQQVKRYFEIDDKNERKRIAAQLEIMRRER